MTTPNIVTNPGTGVRYYDEPGHPRHQQSVDTFVCIQNDEIINTNMDWPMINGLPQPDAYLRFYLRGAPKLRAYDSRVFYETSVWEPVDYPNPKVGGPAGTYEETLTLHRHPEHVLRNQVEAQRLQANARLYPSYEDPMLSVLYAEAVDRNAEGKATAVMTQLLARRQALIDAGMQNMERAAALLLDIQAGRAFDLSEGWTYEIPQVDILPAAVNGPST